MRIRSFLAAGFLAVGVTSLGVAALAGSARADGGSFHGATISGHQCDSTEWHFVITQVDGTAPSSITVSWSNGTSSVLGLSSLTGKTAHYRTTAHLGDGVTVTGASVDVPEGTTVGNFNLSHGPCGSNGSTTTTAPPTTVPPTTVPPTSTPPSSTPPSSTPPSSTPPSSTPPSSTPPSSTPPSSTPPSSTPPSTTPPTSTPPTSTPPTSTPPSSTPPTDAVVLPIVIGNQTPTTTAAPAPETPVTTTAALPSSLPVTGGASTALALVGLVAVLLGAGLVFMGRRQPAEA